MSENQNEQVYRRVIGEAYNRGNLNVLDQVLSPNFVEHQSGIVPPSVDGLKRSIEALRSAFPDLNVTVDDILANGNETWARLTARGTQKGAFAGLVPSGKPFAITVFDLCRFQNGKIVEHWGVADQMALRMQIRADASASIEEVAMTTGGKPAPTPPVNWI